MMSLKHVIINWLACFLQFFSQSSNLLNQARLKILQAQQQHIQGLLSEARKRLAAAGSDPNSYSVMLRDLVIQALYQVLPFNYHIIYM